MSSPWAHESTALDVNKADGNLTTNAERIFSDNDPSWEFLLEQVGISPTYQVTYLLGGRMKVTHLMFIWPNMQEAQERLKKTLCVVCVLSCNIQK